jgi:hypothetical protein
VTGLLSTLSGVDVPWFTASPDTTYASALAVNVPEVGPPTGCVVTDTAGDD